MYNLDVSFEGVLRRNACDNLWAVWTLHGRLHIRPMTCLDVFLEIILPGTILENLVATFECETKQLFRYIGISVSEFNMSLQVHVSLAAGVCGRAARKRTDCILYFGVWMLFRDMALPA